MERIDIYLSMLQKFTNLKDSEIVATPLCLGNISKDWSINNMKKKQNLMVMFILVLIPILPMLMIVTIFTII